MRAPGTRLSLRFVRLLRFQMTFDATLGVSRGGN
jgi:hypothetical protein